MADDLQRLLAGDRRAHRLLDIPGVTYFQSVHANRLAFIAVPPSAKRYAASRNPWHLLKAWMPDTRPGVVARHPLPQARHTLKVGVGSIRTDGFNGG
jgi:hypothetical protein